MVLNRPIFVSANQPPIKGLKKLVPKETENCIEKDKYFYLHPMFSLASLMGQSIGTWKAYGKYSDFGFSIYNFSIQLAKT